MGMADQDEEEDVVKEGKTEECEGAELDAADPPLIARGLAEEGLEQERWNQGQDRHDPGLHPGVEAPDDEPLQQRAEQADHDERKNHREPERHAPLKRHGRDIGAEHHQLVMGEIDDVHHAEDDDQPQRRQQQEGGIGAELAEHARDQADVVHGGTCARRAW
ncbi:MAG: hypothetical protein HC871_06835 [Rhizobiales bacterium]|nr:hypothetical protein [Hyphomicrobiales bacterium]